MTDECLHACAYRYGSEAERRNAIGVRNHHDNYHRPHTACRDRPRPLASTSASTMS